MASFSTYFYKYKTLYCTGLVTAQGWILRGHLLKCWQRAAALCMLSSCFTEEGKPEPGSVVMPQRWHGAGSAHFSGVPTKNSWRVQSSPWKTFPSSLQSALTPRSCSAKVTSYFRYYFLPVTEKTCRLQPRSGGASACLLLHHGPVLALGAGREKMAEKRQQKPGKEKERRT